MTLSPFHQTLAKNNSCFMKKFSTMENTELAYLKILLFQWNNKINMSLKLNNYPKL